MSYISDKENNQSDINFLNDENNQNDINFLNDKCHNIIEEERFNATYRSCSVEKMVAESVDSNTTDDGSEFKLVQMQMQYMEISQKSNASNDKVKKLQHELTAQKKTVSSLKQLIKQLAGNMEELITKKKNDSKERKRAKSTQSNELLDKIKNIESLEESKRLLEKYLESYKCEVTELKDIINLLGDNKHCEKNDEYQILENGNSLLQSKLVESECKLLELEDMTVKLEKEKLQSENNTRLSFKKSEEARQSLEEAKNLLEDEFQSKINCSRRENVELKVELARVKDGKRLMEDSLHSNLRESEEREVSFNLKLKDSEYVISVLNCKISSFKDAYHSMEENVTKMHNSNKNSERKFNELKNAKRCVEEKLTESNENILSTKKVSKALEMEVATLQSENNENTKINSQLVTKLDVLQTALSTSRREHKHIEEKFLQILNSSKNMEGKFNELKNAKRCVEEKLSESNENILLTEKNSKALEMEVASLQSENNKNTKTNSQLVAKLDTMQKLLSTSLEEHKYLEEKFLKRLNSNKNLEGKVNELENAKRCVEEKLTESNENILSTNKISKALEMEVATLQNENNKNTKTNSQLVTKLENMQKLLSTSVEEQKNLEDTFVKRLNINTNLEGKVNELKHAKRSVEEKLAESNETILLTKKDSEALEMEVAYLQSENNKNTKTNSQLVTKLDSMQFALSTSRKEHKHLEEKFTKLHNGSKNLEIKIHELKDVYSVLNNIQ